jgi:hypothetical protein
MKKPFFKAWHLVQPVSIHNHVSSALAVILFEFSSLPTGLISMLLYSAWLTAEVA